MERIQAAIATGSDAELLAVLEDAEFEVRPRRSSTADHSDDRARSAAATACPECAADPPASAQLAASGQPSAQVYGAQLVAHYTVNDVCVAAPPSVACPLATRPDAASVGSASARFLWKRVPQECKADPELAQLWNLGKLLWTRQYVEMFEFLKSIGVLPSVVHRAQCRAPCLHLPCLLTHCRGPPGPSLSALNQSTVARFTSTSLSSPWSCLGRRLPRLPAHTAWLLQRPTGSGPPTYWAKPTLAFPQRCE
jgi:hypothetical protein